MNVNDTVTVMTLSGEYVGTLIENNGNDVIIGNPKLVTNGEQGLALADGISATGIVPETVHFHNVTFVTLAHTDVADAHKTAVQGE